MSFVRIRTTVDRRPGHLASLASALTRRGSGIIGLFVRSGSGGEAHGFAAGTSAAAGDVEAARAAAFARRTRPPAGPAVGERTLCLTDGTEVLVRALTSDSEEAVRGLHGRCSPGSRWFRYFTAMPALPRHMFDRLCDRDRGESVIACHNGQVRAMANLVYCADPGVAELALLVEDDWQGRGLGAELARVLVGVARDRGLTEVHAIILWNNQRMRRLMVGLGSTVGPTDDPGVVEARLPLAATV
ncbi:N-acetyltransferase family protein [Streptosporangium sp. OZ121]|uniref:GNAT family N-acetyltransferase n=1 Tax=Streptosporangium sp. OZ121 TaxID=3444183 RepID=UPI003F7AA15A